MAKIDFPYQLRQWRKEKGLLQRELADLLGVSRQSIGQYERGDNIPSLEAASKLVSLGFNKDFVKANKHRYKGISYDKPLSNEEQKFAEIHHNIVLGFLKKKELSYEDWYDVVVFGYLRAVKKWFARQDLHIYSFSTIAYAAMRTNVGNELAKQKHQPLSLDNVIPGTDGITYMDILCDPRDCVGM